MRVLGCRPWLWKLLAILLLVVATATTIFLHGTDIWNHYHSFAERRRNAAAHEERMAAYPTHANPLIRALATGQIKSDDTLESVTSSHPPPKSIRYGAFVKLAYGDSPRQTVIVVKNGRLIAAWQEAFDGKQGYCDSFFSMTAADLTLHTTTWNAMMAGQAILAVPESRNAALAVAGFGATFDPDDWPLIAKPSAGK